MPRRQKVLTAVPSEPASRGLAGRPTPRIRRLIHALSVIRREMPEAEVQMIIAFLEIASSPGIRMATLGKRMGYASSTNHRIVSILSDKGGKGGSQRKPMHLIETRPDPCDARGLVLGLTSKGCELAESVGAQLELPEDASSRRIPS